MTDPHDEYGEILRRALHAEAETVVPAADGLDRIRARISERPASRFSWASAWSWFTATWARPAMAGAASLAMAAVVVSGTPAISSFTVGGHRAPDQGEHGEKGTSGGTEPGGGGQPAQSPSEPWRPQGLSPTKSRQPSPSLGGPACGRPLGAEVPSPASETDTPPPVEQTSPCESTATTTAPTSPDPTESTDDPPPPGTPPPPESPPTGGDQQPLSQVDP
ncbi:hypothetical protein [Actinomadura sp. HBU206391]|uniref:hypothetical protein n=1 Tax=Actinomadura sp. HBU206391 TaxID=2731692 RepID=UPI00164FF918|nr:hypothetical protein [Actinomadura sp. HBU206391]MBC6461948.1 hypothetical protein [Actinomadura sp. HBU206391]